jgi:hypothetical protein
MYEQRATLLTPALVIYLIDASDSMNEPYDTNQKKIDLVQQALNMTIQWMVDHAHNKMGVLEDRYHIAILAYGTTVLDVIKENTNLDVARGILPLTGITKLGNLELHAGGKSDMAAGFEAVEKLLQAHLSDYKRCPAPLICHFTDAGYTTKDPMPVIRNIQKMRVDDGPILVEHVYTADHEHMYTPDHMLRKPVQDWRQWSGIVHPKDVTDLYARYFSSLSSPLPETSRENINASGYHLQKGARLFFPGDHPQFIPLTFAIPDSPTRF